MNQNRNRMMLSLTTPMRIALTVLSEKSGLPPTTQATMLLRQALHQTLNSQEVQRRVAQHNAQRNHATWVTDRVTEHAVESTYAKVAQEQEPTP